MRFIIGFLLLLAVCAAPALAQIDTVWTCRIESGLHPIINGVAALANGDFAVTGTIQDAAQNLNIFAARVSSEGQVLWTRNLGVADMNEQGMAVAEAANGTIVIAGGRAETPVSRAVLLVGLNANGDSLWSRSYSSTGQARGNDIVRCADGTFAVVGYCMGADGQHSDLWLLRCTTQGDTVSTLRVGSDGTDTGSRLCAIEGGDLILGGQTNSTGQGDFDHWYIRVSGSAVDTAIAGTVERERCQGMAVNDSTVFMVGYRQYLETNVYDGVITKLSRTGEVRWHQAYGTEWTREQFRGVAALSGGGVICVGYAGPADNNLRPWIVVVNAAGDLQQVLVDSTVDQGYYYGITPVPLGGHVIYGNIVEDGVSKGYLVRTVPSAGLEGYVRDPETDLPVPDVRISPAGSSLYALTNAAGHFMLGLTPGTYDLLVGGRCSSLDTVLTVTAYPDSFVQMEIELGVPHYVPCSETSINIIAQNRQLSSAPFTLRNDGTGPLNFGFTTESYQPSSAWLSVSPSHGQVPAHDSLVVQIQVQADTTNGGVFDFFGSLTVHAHSCPDSVTTIPVLVSVLRADPADAALPRDYAFYDPAPNPFNPSTLLAFDLPRAGELRLVIYDVMGREVRVLQQGVVEAGHHTLQFDGSDLPSGLYIARLESPAFTATRKLLLVK